MSGGGGGGGGGPQQVTSTVTQSSLPPYVQPYFEQVLQRGLFESARPYRPYSGQRLAQFSPEETYVQRNIMGLQRPEQLGMASDIAARVGYAGMPSGMDITGQFQPGAITPTYQATPFSTGYTAGSFAPGFQAREFQNQYRAGTITPGYQAGTFTPGYQAGTVGPGFEAGSIAAPGTISTYMSPYTQNVVERQKQAAVEDFRRSLPGIGAAAVQAGAKGGTREALIQAEAARGLQDRLAGIEATGAEKAFESAQRAFEADRAARLQAAQYGLGAFQAQEAARQEAARMGLTAQQAGEAARQEAARMGLTARQAEEAARQAEAEMGLRAFQATGEERRFAATTGLQAQQAGEAARQEAARLGLSAQEQSDAARRAEEQFRMQAQQFNIEQQRQRALLGLEGLAADRAGMQQRLSAAEMLAGLGGRQQELDLQRLGAMGGVGAERRALMQRGLDIGYEDFLRQQAYGREQLGYLSNLLQGIPIQPGSTVSTFGRVPSTGETLLGGGLGALGLYQALGRGRG